MINPNGFDKQLQNLLVIMASEGMHNAARGISDMVGEMLEVTKPVVRRIPLTEIPSLLGSPETEAVGIYLRAEGDIGSQIMMVIPYHYALELVDLLMGEKPGTTQSLGRLERSALAELGNLTGTFFLNAVASITGLGSRPSPPAVMVDMVGAILDVILATSAAGLSESVLMVQATFIRGHREAEVGFWVIPDRTTLEAVARRER
ncbi:MAG: chemotaxis protein CheC [Chloroflexi bacterium]|nr:chemotaxis protein CheC [Chloroflexota bacterium]